MITKTKRIGAVRTIAAALTAASVLAAAFGTVITVNADTAYGKTIYLETDQTENPYIYYWYKDSQNGIDWPGKAMSKVSGEDDLFFYDLPRDISELNGVIFNKDDSGDKMTGDVTNINGNLYDLGKGVWSMHDTSSITITEYKVICDKTFYTGQEAVLYINAEGGDGNLQYKISVKGSEDKVLSDYSKNNSAVWTPSKAGDYNVVFEVKDGSGDTNARELSMSVEDSVSAVEPVFLGVYPKSNSQIKKGETVDLDIKGAGGNINNKILFYKTEIIDPNGTRVNTPYYKTNGQISFDADVLGTYTVYVSIQNNSANNTTTKKTLFYSSVDDPTDDPGIIIPVSAEGVTLDKTSAELEIGESFTLKAEVKPSNADDKNIVWSTNNAKAAVVENGKVTAVGSGTATITAKTKDGGFTAKCVVTVKPDKDSILLGDYDSNGKVERKDAQYVQKAALGLTSITSEQKERCDVDGDGTITLKDAALIKQLAAGVIDEF
ncbi:MAG: Ig-like domain-containing protein [Clostridia bacterium]|nr:Ig-like domain-containing protein [Clostridia bacterium]